MVYFDPLTVLWFPQRSAVVPFPVAVLFDGAYSCFRNFNSTIPVNVIRVKSYLDSVLDPIRVCQ